LFSSNKDDDFTLRMFTTNLCIMRSNKKLEKERAPFTMLSHKVSKINTNRFKTLSESLEGSLEDGLSNIDQEAKLKKIKLFLSFTHLTVTV
jgi:hypothetical protein